MARQGAVNWYDKKEVITFANHLGPGWVVWKAKDDNFHPKYNCQLASTLGACMPTAKEIIIVHRT